MLKLAKKVADASKYVAGLDEAIRNHFEDCYKDWLTESSLVDEEGNFVGCPSMVTRDYLLGAIEDDLLNLGDDLDAIETKWNFIFNKVKDSHLLDGCAHC